MNKRALYSLLGVMIVLVVLRYGFFNGAGATGVVPAALDSVPQAEQRLQNLRRVVAAIPAKDDSAKKAAAELSEREHGMLQAATLQQAEAALFLKVQEIGTANQIDVRANQGFREKALNKDYAEVTVTVAFTCGIDQLVNFLAGIANQPEILATDEIHITAGADPKKKAVQVRLGVSSPVPRKLLVERKGAAAF